MIQVRHLFKRFGPTTAVRDVSFDVARGEVLGFLGPNGAGKTTTMRILTGYIPPTDGSAEIAGHNLSTESLAIRRQVGYLPESSPLYGDMEVEDFLRFIAEIRGIPSSEIRGKINRMIGLCGLEDVVGRIIHHLSKGYRQRVGLAQAMIHDPDILILDEPTSGLDPNQIVEIRELIKELGRKKTVILSTHILPEVSATCGRILIINEGSIVASGTPEELSARMEKGGLLHVTIRAGSREDVERTFADAPFIEEVSPLDGGGDGLHRFSIRSTESDGLSERVFQIAVEKGWSLAELHAESVTLEDVFRRLTGKEKP